MGGAMKRLHGTGSASASCFAVAAALMLVVPATHGQSKGTTALGEQLSEWKCIKYTEAGYSGEPVVVQAPDPSDARRIASQKLGIDYRSTRCARQAASARQERTPTTKSTVQQAVGGEPNVYYECKYTSQEGQTSWMRNIEAKSAEEARGNLVRLPNWPATRRIGDCQVHRTVQPGTKDWHTRDPSGRCECKVQSSRDTMFCELIGSTARHARAHCSVSELQECCARIVDRASPVAGGTGVPAPAAVPAAGATSGESAQRAAPASCDGLSLAQRVACEAKQAGQKLGVPTK